MKGEVTSLYNFFVGLAVLFVAMALAVSAVSLLRAGEDEAAPPTEGKDD